MASSRSVPSLSGAVEAATEQLEIIQPLASGHLRDLRNSVATAMGYYVGTRIGFAFTPSSWTISTFWPANAILLAGLLLTPRRTWWLLTIFIFPVHMLVQLQRGIPIWTATGWYVTNTSEALLGAFLITSFADVERLFDSVRGILVFVVFGVFLAPFVTSFFDAGAVVVTGWGEGFLPIGTHRFWSNVLAELTVVPAIVLSFSTVMTWIRKASATRWLEAAFLILTSVFLTILIFGVQPISIAASPALLYAPLPLLLWATIRFGPGGLSLCVLALSMISLWCTTHGRTPFPYASVEQNVLSLQILLCVVVVPLIFLSATLAEGNRTKMSLRRVSNSLMRAQEEERHRIACELHDDLGQSLAMIQVRLRGLMDKSNEVLEGGLIELCDNVAHASRTTHEISHNLYPRQLEFLGLASSVKRLIADISQGTQIKIDSEIADVPRSLKPSISLCLFRIAQEALHNVVAHSHANNARVELWADNRQIFLQVKDDGIGFNLDHEAGGLGLVSMRQRAESVGGFVDIHSRPGGGTRVAVHAPNSAGGS